MLVMGVDPAKDKSETVIMNVVKTRVEKKDRALEGDVRYNLDIQKIECYTHEDMWRQVESMIDSNGIGNNRCPCPRCGVKPSMDCGYSSYDPWNGEYDCEAPDQDGDLMCEYCHHIHCSLCKLEEKYNFKEEEFCIE